MNYVSQNIYRNPLEGLTLGRESSSIFLLYKKQLLKVSENLEKMGVGFKLRLREQTVYLGQVGLKDEIVEFIIRDERVAQKILQRFNLFDLANAYFDGDLDINGDFWTAIDVLYILNLNTDRPTTLIGKSSNLILNLSEYILPVKLQAFESLCHYSNSSEAYECFLDPYMQYTCGLFNDKNESISQSQINKFNYIFENANLKKGFSHLDIGCGWGGLIGYFNKEFSSKSVGVTNTPSQKTYAENNFEASITLGDFETVKRDSKSYDLITVVGMTEHLKPYRKTRLLKDLKKQLSSKGKIYLQTIAKPENFIGGAAYQIVQKFVFPGHYLLSKQELDFMFKKLGFEYFIEPVDHGYHYGLTTKLWAQNVQLNENVLVSRIGKKNYRIYLAYLAFASKMFLEGKGSLMRYFLIQK